MQHAAQYRAACCTIASCLLLTDCAVACKVLTTKEKESRNFLQEDASGTYHPGIVGAFDGVGAALELLRKERGVEEGEMLRRLKLKNYSSLSRVEGAGANPQAKKLARYLEAIGATPYDLARALDQVNGRIPEGPFTAARITSSGPWGLRQPPSPQQILERFPQAPDHLQRALQRAYSEEHAAGQAVEMVLGQIEAWHKGVEVPEPKPTDPLDRLPGQLGQHVRRIAPDLDEEGRKARAAREAGKKGGK